MERIDKGRVRDLSTDIREGHLKAKHPIELEIATTDDNGRVVGRYMFEITEAQATDLIADVADTLALLRKVRAR